jgi:hypothetical protein
MRAATPPNAPGTLPPLTALSPEARIGARAALAHLRTQAAAMAQTARKGHRHTLSATDCRLLAQQAAALRAAASSIHHQLKPPGLR